MFKSIAAAVVLAATVSTAPAANAAEFGIGFGNGGGWIELAPVYDGRRGGWDDGWRYERHTEDRLSAREVRRIVRDAGFHDVKIVDEDRRTYTLVARNWNGKKRIIEVSAYSGRILSVSRWS